MDMYLEKFIEEKFPVPGHALDLGCGKGYDVACLRHLGWKADGVDRKDCDLNNGYVSGKKYGLVYANYVLPFMRNKQMFTETMAVNLEPHGRVFVATFSDKDPVFLKSGISKEELKEVFSDKFEEIEVSEYDHYDNEEKHKHWHKVLVLTGRKK